MSQHTLFICESCVFSSTKRDYMGQRGGYHLWQSLSRTFHGTSEAQITKGWVSLLIEELNGLTLNEILQLTPDFTQQTGLDVSLISSRSNGFYNIFRFMQQKVATVQIANTPLRH